VLDPAVLAAMEKLEATLDAMNECAPRVRHVNQGMWQDVESKRGEVAESLKAAVC